MVHLVSQFVEAHEAEESPPRLALVSLDLREACTGAAERLRASVEAKQQRIAVTLPAGPAVARAEAATLARVLENLPGNALKFSPRESCIELAVTNDGAHWQIEVRDEGPGVPEDERGQLFQNSTAAARDRPAARPAWGSACPS